MRRDPCRSPGGRCSEPATQSPCDRRSNSSGGSSPAGPAGRSLRRVSHRCPQSRRCRRRAAPAQESLSSQRCPPVAFGRTIVYAAEECCGCGWKVKIVSASCRSLPANDAKNAARRRSLRRWPLLLLARTGQDAGQCIVALVAGVFVNTLASCIERHLAAPRTGIQVRILHGELVENFAG